MTRFVYPEEGILLGVKTDFDDMNTSLTSALRTNMRVPSKFRYKSYLLRVPAKVSKDIVQTKLLKSKVEEIDKKYRILAEDLESDAESLEPFELKVRERLIK